MFQSEKFFLNNALNEAAMEGDLQAIIENLEKGAEIDNQKTDKTPLWLAIDAGHIEAAKLLIEKGADANCHNRFGWSALHMAVVSGNQELVQILAEAQAYVNRRDRSGETPLMSAIKTGQTKIAEYLMSRGADHRMRDDNGNTPLHFAAEMANEVIAKLLLEKGAVSILNKDGKSPADLGKDNMAASLIEQHEMSKVASAGKDMNVDESAMLNAEDIPEGALVEKKKSRVIRV